MSTPSHVARVMVTFEFVGLLPPSMAAVSSKEAERWVKDRFKLLDPDIRGFIEERRDLVVVISTVEIPVLPPILGHPEI